MGIFITIFAGVSVFVLGQIFVRVFIEPLQELLKTIGKIAYSILYFSNTTPKIMSKEDVEEATKTLRSHASKIRSLAYTLPAYNLWFSLGIIKVSKKSLIDVSKELIGYSNIVRVDHREHNRSVEQSKMEKKIRKLLKFS